VLFAHASAWFAKKAVSTQRENKKSPPCDGDFFVKLTCILHGAEAGVDFAEYVADDRAEDHESGDHNDGDQNEN